MADEAFLRLQVTRLSHYIQNLGREMTELMVNQNNAATEEEAAAVQARVAELQKDQEDAQKLLNEILAAFPQSGGRKDAEVRQKMKRVDRWLDGELGESESSDGGEGESQERVEGHEEKESAYSDFKRTLFERIQVDPFDDLEHEGSIHTDEISTNIEELVEEFSKMLSGSEQDNKKRRIRPRIEAFEEKVSALLSAGKEELKKHQIGAGKSLVHWLKECSELDAEWGPLKARNAEVNKQGIRISRSLLDLMLLMSKKGVVSQFQALSSLLKSANEGENFIAMGKTVQLLEMADQEVQSMAAQKKAEESLEGSEAKEGLSEEEADNLIMVLVAEILHLDYILTYPGLPADSRASLLDELTSLTAVLNDGETLLQAMELIISEHKETSLFISAPEEERTYGDIQQRINELWRDQV